MHFPDFTFSNKAVCLVFCGFLELVVASLTPRQTILFCGPIFKAAEHTNLHVPSPLSTNWAKRSATRQNQLHSNDICLSKRGVFNSPLTSMDCGSSLESCNEPRAERIMNFQAWLIDRGVRGIGSSVRIASSGERGYGLFCARDIQEGEVRANSVHFATNIH
jgi:hypothetical protein